MAEAHDRRQILYQNLLDAGIRSEDAACWITLLEEGHPEQMLCCLARQRRTLLDGIHFQQKQIDCLDLLMYRIQGGSHHGNQS